MLETHLINYALSGDGITGTPDIVAAVTSGGSTTTAPVFNAPSNGYSSATAVVTVPPGATIALQPSGGTIVTTANAPQASLNIMKVA